MAEDTYICTHCKKIRSAIFKPSLLIGQKRVVWAGCPACYDTFWEKLIGIVGKLPTA